jgi:phosphate transport system permease protein
VGTITAIYLSEYAPHRVREIVKPFLELLTAVPTVVFGYFALLFVTPLLRHFIPSLPGFNMLSAGLVIGVMIIPYVSSLSEDAMRAVPMHLREASYAMGATRFQTSVRVVFPAALSGVASAYVLGFSRAIGETMVVAIAAGMQPNLTDESPGTRRHHHRLHRSGFIWETCRTAVWATKPFSPRG